jgi:hypothetical protein
MINWNRLQELSSMYDNGKKCNSGSLQDFVTEIKKLYDDITEEEKKEWRGSARWGNETFDSCESILKENKLI